MMIELPRPDTIRLWTDFPTLRDWRETLALVYPGREYTKAYTQGEWDGIIRPGQFQKENGHWCLELGRGYLERVMRDFPGCDVQLRYEPARMDLNVGKLPSMLRDYQVGGLEQVFGRRWGQMDMATNAGKGAIIALSAKHAAPYPVVILADEVSVYDALEEQLAEWAPDLPVSLVKAGVKEPPTERVSLVMVKTVHNRLFDSSEDKNGKLRYTPTPGPWLDWARSVRFAFLDEADLATANTWQRVVRQMHNTDFRIGFSGSFPEPDTLEGRTVEETLGPTLEVVRNRTLIDRGISAELILEIVPYDAPVPPDWKLSGLSGPARRRLVYQEAVVDNPERHELVRSLLLPDDPNVILVRLIEHGENLAEVIPDSVFLKGTDDEDTRFAAVESLRRGEIQNLIVTTIFDRGTNRLGNAVGLVLASGEGSERQTLQRIGRILRRSEGKEFAFLRDVADRGHKYLNRASRRRAEVYVDEGFDITIRDV